MIQQPRFTSVVHPLTLLGCLAVLAASPLYGEEPPPAPPQSASACTSCEGTILTLDSLVRMSKEELEQLYCNACPGPIPEGFLPGKAIRHAGTCLAVPSSKLSGCLWHGKLFESCDGTLVNCWCGGVHAVHAKVEYAESWLDGKPAIVMDYEGMSKVIWHDVRDEIRAICPGLYLGVMFKRTCGCPKFVMFFALEACPCCK